MLTLCVASLSLSLLTCGTGVMILTQQAWQRVQSPLRAQGMLVERGHLRDGEREEEVLEVGLPAGGGLCSPEG